MRFSDCQRARSVIWLVASFYSTSVPPVQGQIKPQFDRSTLEMDGRVIHPLGIRLPASPEYRAGARRFLVRGDTVEELGVKGDLKVDRPTWSVKSPDGYGLNLLAISGNTAFFVAFGPMDEKRGAEAETPPQLRRLDLASRQWKPPLAVPVVKRLDTQRDAIVSALADGDRLAVLTEQSEPDEILRNRKLTGYRLSFFRGAADEPAWSQTFESGGSRPEPGVHVMAAVMPDYAGSDLQRLAWLDDGLLVCAGEKEDLIHFDVTGKIRWRVPRIWEFSRGFIGPSVWSHYIARFGTEDWDRLAM